MMHVDQWVKKKLQDLSPEQQWLIWMAFVTYLASGVYLCLFTQGVDFHLVYAAARKIAAGHGALIYDRFLAFTPGQNSLFYMYPPTVALSYVPLAGLSPTDALGVFHLISHLMLWVTLTVWMKDWVPSVHHAWRTLVAVLLFFPLYYGLHMGQSEIPVLACLVLGWHLYRRGNWWLAGFLFSIAMQFKMFLAFLLLHWLITGQWKLLVACVLGLGAQVWLGISIVSWPVWLQWAHKLAAPIGIEAFVDNQSLTGFLCRTLSFLSPGVVSGMRASLSLILIATYIWTVRRNVQRQSPEMLLSFAVITLLLVSPHTDTHHLTFLLIPFVTLIAQDRMDFSAFGFYAFFACFVPLMAFHFLWDERAQRLAAGPGAILLSIPFLVLLMFWENWRKRLSRLH